MTTTTTERPAAKEAKATPVAEFRHQMGTMREQIMAALPKHVDADKFIRVVMTGVQINPQLLSCNRSTLLRACIEAATDGLIPDGREGALVPYKGSVQWIAMVWGLVKLVRQSGEVVTIGANIVRQGDEFSHWIDEKGEHFKHVPQYTEDERPLRVVYAYAVTKDGGVYFEALSAAEVEKFRGLSRAGRDDSPWAMWPDEMSKVRAIKRLTKRLPMSADAIAAIERDNLREAGMLGVAQQRSGIDALNSALAGGGDAGNGGAPALTHDPSQPAEFFNTSINVNFADPVGGALVGNATGGDAPQGQQGAATQAASKPDAEAIAALTDDWIAAIDAADSEAALNDAAQRAGKALMKAPAAARERVIAALEVAGAKFGAAATKKGNGKADKPAEKAAD